MTAHSERIRVLWLIKGLGPGGAEQLLLNHARVRDRSRFRYDAAYLVPWKDQLVAPLEALDVSVHALDGPREGDLRWAWRLRRLLVRERIDVVHVHSPYVAAVARLTVRTIGRRDRPAIVSTEHNRWPRHARPTRWANRATLRLDDATLAVSDDVRSTMPRAARHRVEVVQHGVNVDEVRAQRAERTAVRREFGLDDKELLVGTVANLRREKAYPDLLEAARLVLDHRPDVSFVAVGQGPLEEELRAIHARLDLGDRFRFLGYRDDATRVMSAFDVFTLASVHEGLPIALLDALVLGVPVAATRVGGVPSVVADGVEGTLTAPGAPSELAAAIEGLARDSDWRSRAGAAAGERGRSLGVEPAVERIEAIYRALARRRPPRRR